MKKITKIVLTGGPCAGKSTAMQLIKNKLLHLGYNVVIRPEGATVLMENGFHPASLPASTWQVANLNFQIGLEDMFSKCAEQSEKPTIILCDRGPLDSKAYLSQSEFQEVANILGTTEESLKNRYDLIIFLDTLATLGNEHYSNANNPHRIETFSEALDANQRTLNTWVGHPKLRIIQNQPEFKQDINAKIEKIMAEILGHLGRPQPLEIERKFLIKKPTIDAIKSNVSTVESEILQIYLKSKPGKESRIRKQTIAGFDTYYYTQKQTHDDLSRYEVEQKITKSEFEYLQTFQDSLRAPIRKKRYYFAYQGQYFELDTYPFFTQYAILELELADANTPITLPPFLNVIRDVTKEKHYKNSEIAKFLFTAKKQKTASGMPGFELESCNL